MKIEKIERSKHKQERVLVYLEGGDLLRITESELLRFGLCIGLDIDDRTVVELQQSGARSETRVRAANMISSRPLSRRELIRKLGEKGAAESDAEAAADWLGEAKIRDELYRRGVPRELWEDALAASPDVQEAIARVIAQKTKGRTLDEKGRKRLSDMLLRRGFAWRDVRAALARIGEDTTEFDYEE